jgi:hypothetical protein
MLYNKKCKYCSIDFFTKNKNKRFCNISCSNKYRHKNKPLREKFCVSCGKKIFYKNASKNLYCEECKKKKEIENIAKRKEEKNAIEQQTREFSKNGKTWKIIENTSNIYYNGSEWESNNYGKFKILEKLNKYRLRKNNIKDYIYYLCEFWDGSIVEINCQRIKDGQIKNCYSPSLFGVGYVGQGQWQTKMKGKNTKEYTLFKNILSRCYNNQNKNYKYYGEKGITLDKNLHNFQNFCLMISNLPNYDKWKHDKMEEWCLDKDFVCKKLNISPKIYSKETCIFITKKENTAEMINRNLLTGLTYVGIRVLDNYEEEFTNQNHFAKKWGLDNSHVNSCIHNKRERHKGWVFKIKKECEI